MTSEGVNTRDLFSVGDPTVMGMILELVVDEGEVPVAWAAVLVRALEALFPENFAPAGLARRGSQNLVL